MAGRSVCLQEKTSSTGPSQSLVTGGTQYVCSGCRLAQQGAFLLKYITAVKEARSVLLFCI